MNLEHNLPQLIEAVLFWKGEAISKKKLHDLLKVEESAIVDALNELKTNLESRGIVLLEKDDEVMLGTSPSASSIIESLEKEELSKELSKATLETLSVVLYMAPVRRSTIDYVRGVNSQFSLRHLEIRGLVEKIPDDKDNRSFLYRPTFECLSFLGASSREEIPDFDLVTSKLRDLEQQKIAEQNIFEHDESTALQN